MHKYVDRLPGQLFPHGAALHVGKIAEPEEQTSVFERRRRRKPKPGDPWVALPPRFVEAVEVVVEDGGVEGLPTSTRLHPLVTPQPDVLVRGLGAT